MAVLTSTGLTIRRYPEIVSKIISELQQNVSSEITGDENTTLGQIIQIVSNEIATLEEVLMELNDSKDRDKAYDEQLDALLYLVGLERQSVSKSSGQVFFTTQEDVTISTGTIVENPSTRDRFIATESVTIDRKKALAIDSKIGEGLPTTTNTGIRCVINGTTHIYYPTVSNETDQNLIIGMAGVIVDYGSPEYTASWYEDNGTPVLRVSSLTEETISFEPSAVFSQQTFDPFLFKASVNFEAVENGAIVVPSGAITRLITGVGGVISLQNPEPFGVGRGLETNEEFRERASRSLAISGSSTYSAIFSALSNVEGVSNLVLVENNTATTDSEGRPPHSFEAIIEIPDSDYYNQLVGETLWNEKPIGIQTYGLESVDIVDENGQVRTLYFSRPQEVSLVIEVDYTLYDEEPLTSNITQVIKDIVLDYATKFTSGVDTIPKRIASAIYNGTSGIDDIVVRVKKSSDPSFTTDRLSISNREIAVISGTDITVSEV